MNDASRIESLAQLACQHVRSVTGFGRVLVYQFDARRPRPRDGRSQATTTTPPTWASISRPRDIPAQARELYALSRIRLIQDANYTPAPLVPAMNPVTGKPNDLSFAVLRSVSPVHLQYMRNMHTLASMSVSLMVKGKLWGLISCHNEGTAAGRRSRSAPPASSWARSWRCASNRARTPPSCSSASNCAASWCRCWPA